MSTRKVRLRQWLSASVLGVAILTSGVDAQTINLAPAAAHGGSGPDFPPLDKVTEGFERVASSASDGLPTLYSLWVRKRDGAVLAGLPHGYAQQKYFIALTLAGGSPFAGLQSGDLYVYWRQFDHRLALIEPNVDIRSTGDSESKSSIGRLFTDRVVLDMPITTMVPPGGPIIDLKSMLVDQINKFFPRAGAVNTRLASLKTLKAFPQNIEIAYEIPLANGRLQTFHYSISVVPPSDGYRPRAADPRIGYFTTTYEDFGKFTGNEVRTRYINRWHLEKADLNLKMSPPKRPIVYYIEHTTPLRYRRWVAQGALYWNAAFEKVGISNAIQVNFQDAETKEHMDKDPEDVRYNFIRWLNNGVGLAIGPSRVHPLTGEILDADVILTDGWIRAFQTNYNELLPKLAMENFGPETLAWLDEHPQWDPRVRMAPPGQREQMAAARMQRRARATEKDPLADFAVSGRGAHCMAADGMAFNLDQLRLTLDMIDPASFAKADDDTVDGIPSSFVGPLLADLVAHEVGHTLGLRHNFKGSSIYTLAEINGDTVKGKKPFAGSVMDYMAANISLKDGKLLGDWSMIGIGPYDFWAIEYGYTAKEDLKPILARVAEPELAFATDEDTMGPDPLARRYDFSRNPLDFANSQVALAKFHRERLIEKFVKDGDSWSKARKGYLMTLNLQTRAVSMMANWLGGAFVHRDFKGDPKGRLPIEVVPVEMQRAALSFVLENTFRDEIYGLSPELLQRLTTDGNHDDDRSYGEEAAWPIHDRILGVQNATLTMLMNPTTLRRVYDNESRVQTKHDVLTLPEILEKITDAVWTEIDAKQIEARKKATYTSREPMISSLRRNLQREHLDRLVDLSLPGKLGAAAYKPIANLAVMQLRELQGKIAAYAVVKADPYTKAHLQDAESRIKKALEATMVINANNPAPTPFLILFGSEAQGDPSKAVHPAGCQCGLHRWVPVETPPQP